MVPSCSGGVVFVQGESFTFKNIYSEACGKPVLLEGAPPDSELGGLYHPVRVAMKPDFAGAPRDKETGPMWWVPWQRGQGCISQSAFSAIPFLKLSKFERPLGLQASHNQSLAGAPVQLQPPSPRKHLKAAQPPGLRAGNNLLEAFYLGRIIEGERLILGGRVGGEGGYLVKNVGTWERRAHVHEKCTFWTGPINFVLSEIIGEMGGSWSAVNSP